MAIVDDISRDRRTKNVLAQTNTKTVSAPPASTGLVGDLTPAEVFTVEDFDLIKNQVHLEEKNFQLMEALNVMGQITNMQSQSGPISGTGVVKEFLNTTGSGSPKSTLLEPSPGEAYEVTAIEWKTKNANAGYWRLVDPDDSEVLVEYKTAVGSLDVTTVPIRVVYPQTLIVTYGSATGDNQTNIAYHRVR